MARRLITESQYHRKIIFFPLVASEMFALYYFAMVIITSVKEERLYFDFFDPIDLLSLVILISFPYIIYRLLRYDVRAYVFKKKGIPFKGEVIAQTPLYGGERGQQINLIIEFFEEGNKKKFYSQNYASNPNGILKSSYCMIYKYKNKYIENDFEYRENENDPSVDIRNVERISWINRKNDNNFVN